MDKEQCTEQKIDAVMLKRWHLIVGVVSIVAPAMLFFAKIQIDIAVIKTQSESIVKSIDNIDNKNKEQDNLISEAKNKITEICTILKISSKN